MIIKRTPEELYAIVEKAIPEPGIKRTETEAMLSKAIALREGPIAFFEQSTVQILQQLLSRQHTYHSTINDYDFCKRLFDALQPQPTSPE